MNKKSIESLKEILIEMLQQLWNGGIISKDTGEYLIKEIEKLK